jgi:preprotein translocase subunit SecG
MQTILVVVHLFLAIGVITLILLQHGKGADAGAAFGSGASATVFGAKGSASFLSRTTAILSTLFFVTSMALAYYASQAGHKEGLMDKLVPVVNEIPAAPVEDAEVPAVPPVELPAADSALDAVPSADKQ